VNEIEKTRGRRFRRSLIVLLAGALGLVGCLERELRPLNPCTISGVAQTIQVNQVEEVDLLFMIDNSGSMIEEQASLAAEIPRLINVLASGENGEETFPPVSDLRVGVISSDMGTGPAGACGSMFGDDGVLLTTGNTANPACMATYPTWLEFAADGGDPMAFATDVQCVATALGTNGCGFEQQLDAILKALTPSTSGITFQGGTVGHGDGQNASFVRERSLLAIIALTDEDDCSAIDPGLFEMDNPLYDPNLNLRCFNHPEAVHPLSRFTDGLLALRAENPDLLVYATITGIPVDLVPNSDMALGPQVDSILADSRMIEMPNPEDSTQLVPSCDIPGRGRAFPPRRMISLAADLEDAGANGVVQSICQEDYSGALDAIIAKIADVLGGTCLPRSLNRNSTGEVECDVVEVIDPEIVPGGCESLMGRVADGIDTELDRPRCIINQVVTDGTIPDGSTPGWYYDDFSADVLDRCEETPQRISFTTGAEPRNGSRVKLECLQSVQGGEEGVTGIGTGCAGNPEICRMNIDGDVLELFPATAPERFGGLICDIDNTATCQAPCESGADCPGGFTCFDADMNPETPQICINPTCN
jgi:hypothetical protein